MEELPGGIRRVTLWLPTRPGHVHAYLLPGPDGYTLVDTGLGLPDAGERWAAELEGLDAPVARIFVTHFHPDHVGAARDLAELTGAPVVQGELDAEQCRLVWGQPDWPAVLGRWFRSHGVPEENVLELLEEGAFYAPFIRFVSDPEPVHAGERIDGWELVAAPGHADGQLCLLRDGVLVSADHLLGSITPAVGLWPASSPDPLGDYLEALERLVELGPRLALPGHGDPIEDPVGRVREIAAHHRERLEQAARALGPRPRTGFDVSHDLFGDDLKPSARRFAVAETLSHLERLVREGRARRHETVGTVSYTAR